MGLQPLEFKDCLTDSPFFREKLHAHEKELDRTSKAIKELIRECKDLISAAKTLSKAQKNFSQSLKKFKFECIGTEQTEDEQVIEQSLEEFGTLIARIEDEREKILTPAFKTVVEQLELFRKDEIGKAKEEKKKFEKSTTRFCGAIDKHLAVKNKMSVDAHKEADAAVDMERRNFYESSMQYVLVLQGVQEKKKFEFVENLLVFMLSWLNFYHEGYEVHQDFSPYIETLKLKLQKCRGNFEVTNKEAEQLKSKMLEVRGTRPPEQHATMNKNSTREGYLFLLEKKALTTVWTKIYCQYTKESRVLCMIPYTQQPGKGASNLTTETGTLQSCRRRATDSIERRFCFDVTVNYSPDRQQIHTIQALSDDDLQLWLQAMDGKEPIYSQPTQRHEYYSLLDDIGFKFITRCINVIEDRGLDEKGLYRIVGVASKVTKLTTMGLDRRKADKLDLKDPDEWETNTITSALKNYFRSLPEPIMTFELHPQFVQAAKRESKTRMCDLHELVHKLPEQNFEVLKVLVAHLKRVSQNASQNLMTVPNIGVCFGPTLLRPPEETMAAIMDIKWCNIVVEQLIYNYDKFFTQPPEGADVTNSRVLTSSQIANEQPVIGGPASLNLNSIPYMGSTPSTPSHVRHHSSGAAVPATQPRPGNQHANHQHALSDSARDRTGSFGTSQLMSSSYTTGVAPSIAAHAAAANSYSNTTQPQQQQQPQTYAQARQKFRPNTGIHSQYSPDHNSSQSSSSESLTSRSSSANQHSSPVLNSHASTPASNGSGGGGVKEPEMRGPKSDDGVMTRDGSTNGENRHAKVMSSVQHGISRFSQMPNSGGQPPETGRKTRALFACDAENDTELSFQPNDIIHNVRMSKEPGWLEGQLGGRRGLVPANYVTYID